MDFITQNILGATAGHAIFGKSLGRMSALAGALGAAVPDCDFLLERFSDPAIPWEFHRHFTHAFWFVPVGAAIGFAPLLLLPSVRKQWKAFFGAALVGCVTHAPLDCCTSFGTMLYWPISDARVGWDLVSIIDPLFSIPLIALLLIGLLRGSTRSSIVGMIYCFLFFTYAFVQHERAASVRNMLADRRGHTVEHSRVAPTLGNTIVWRSVYESDGMIYADTIRLRWFGDPQVRQGTSIQGMTIEKLMRQYPIDDRGQRAFLWLEHFSDGFIAQVPDRPGAIGDMRYSLELGGFVPLWGIQFDESGDVSRYWAAMEGDRSEAVKELIDVIFNSSEEFNSVRD